MRPLVAHCHFDLGRLFKTTGRPDHAREHLLTAARLYREMDMDGWRDQAGAEMKQLV
jgi:hypothetical protein